MTGLPVVPVQLSDGTRVLAALSSPTGEVEVAWKLYELEDMANAIRGLSRDLLEQIKSLSCDSAEIKFGVSATLEEGKLTALLVSGGAEATVEVTLRWSTQSPSDQ